MSQQRTGESSRNSARRKREGWGKAIGTKHEQTHAPRKTKLTHGKNRSRETLARLQESGGRQPAEQTGHCLYLQRRGVATGRAELSNALLLGGFIKEEITMADNGTTRRAIAFKPSWTPSAALPLKKKAKVTAAAAEEQHSSSPTEVSKVWKVLATSSSAELGIDLVDPDTLLDDDIEEEKTTSNEEGTESACGAIKIAGAGKKRRACKDCSCGLAEEILKEEVGDLSASTQKTGSCGACGKGDAFRCASCPYRGLPSFAAGSKPAIAMNQDGTRKLLIDTSSDIVFE